MHTGHACIKCFLVKLFARLGILQIISFYWVKIKEYVQCFSIIKESHGNKCKKGRLILIVLRDCTDLKIYI